MSTTAINWAFRIIEQTEQKIMLSECQRLVLLALADHHNGRSGQCTPSMARIGKRSGMSERAARGAVRKLEDLGLVATHKRSDRSGQTSNQYILLGLEQSGSGRHKKTARCNSVSKGAGGTLVPPNLEDSLPSEVPGRTVTTAYPKSGGAA